MGDVHTIHATKILLHSFYVRFIQFSNIFLSILYLNSHDTTGHYFLLKVLQIKAISIQSPQAKKTESTSYTHLEKLHYL